MNELTVGNNDGMMADFTKLAEIAKDNPRNLKSFLDEAKFQVSEDINLAAQCNYCLERKSKKGVVKIQGPSVRVAEIALSLYGNCMVSVKITSDDPELPYIEATGTFIDLQKMNAYNIPVRKKVVTNQGIRYSDDMINVTTLAAVSTAFRNVVFKGIPRVYIDKIAETALQVAAGKGVSLKGRIKKMLEVFSNIDVSKEMIEKKSGKNVDNFTKKDLEEYLGYYGAISNKMQTVEEIFKVAQQKTEDDIIEAEFDVTELG